MDIENSKYGEIEEENIRKGYNCSQAVFLAFCDLYGMDEKAAARLSSSFGGGMGRLREVCGAVSGMFMTVGLLYGYDTPGAQQEKADHYKRVQELARAYETENGSIVCRELLGLTEKRQEPTPETSLSQTGAHGSGDYGTVYQRTSDILKIVWKPF